MIPGSPYWCCWTTRPRNRVRPSGARWLGLYSQGWRREWRVISIFSPPKRFRLSALHLVKKEWRCPGPAVISRVIMQLQDLIRGLGVVTMEGPMNREIGAISYDSRRTGPGDLFVAMRGEHFDGHSFIEEAVEQGAVAVVGEHVGLARRATMIVVPDSREALARLASVFYGEPAKELTMIGVTGTNGKTTTTFLVKHLLESAHRLSGLIGTVQYEIGKRVLPAHRTTPESLDLQQLLRH